MRSDDNRRAMLAFKHIEAIAAGDETTRQKYGSMMLKLPALLHSAGVAPALHFVAARSHKDQRRTLKDLAAQLKQSGLLEHANEGALLRRVREANVVETRQLGRELQRCLVWYGRFVAIELKVDKTMDDDRGGDDATN